MTPMNELRRLLEMGQISQADFDNLAPENALAEMLVPRNDIAPMEQNTMRVESGPDVGKVINMDFGGAPAQQAQKLGAPVEVVGKGRGRYSQDGSKVVFADGSTHDLQPAQTAFDAKLAFEAKKRDLDLRKGEADLTRDQAATDYQREQTDALRAQRAVKEDPNSQEVLDKRFGKAEDGMRWKPDGTAELKPGSQKTRDADDVLAILDEAEPLLDKATGSWFGAGIDLAGNTIGLSTDGAEAIAQLKALQGTLVSKMPKMSGPQSDKDVLLYREMAGQIGDPTIPAPQKRAAMKTIRQINERYASGSKSDLNSPPDPRQYVGKRMQAPDGTLYKSDGTRWVRQ